MKKLIALVLMVGTLIGAVTAKVAASKGCTCNPCTCQDCKCGK